MRILFHNIEYARGTRGRWWTYALFFYRLLFLRAKYQRKVLKKIAAMVRREDPDICCFAEIGIHTPISRVNQIKELSDLLGDTHAVERSRVKYCNSLLKRLPYFRGKANGFLSKKNHSTREINLQRGVKCLAYQIEIAPNVTLFFVHLASFFARDARREQLTELADILSQTPGSHILCGDFNIFGGFSELGPLLDRGDLVVMNTERDKTFPTYKPKRAFDLFICSKKLAEQASFEVLPDNFSDHLPILLDVDIDNDHSV